MSACCLEALVSALSVGDSLVWRRAARMGSAELMTGAPLIFMARCSPKDEQGRDTPEAQDPRRQRAFKGAARVQALALAAALWRTDNLGACTAASWAARALLYIARAHDSGCMCGLTGARARHARVAGTLAHTSVRATPCMRALSSNQDAAGPLAWTLLAFTPNLNPTHQLDTCTATAP
jgi:hypothetical protein